MIMIQKMEGSDKHCFSDQRACDLYVIIILSNPNYGCIREAIVKHFLIANVLTRMYALNLVFFYNKMLSTPFQFASNYCVFKIMSFSTCIQ